MALINCPECGKAISDTAPQCIHCGYLLKPEAASAAPAAPATKKLWEKFGKKLLIVGGAVVLVVLALVFVLLYNNVVVPGNAYEAAEKALENQEFEDAAEMFGELGDYKDSKERVLQCYYEQGKFLMDKGDYSEAVEAFESAGNYQDAAVRVTSDYKDSKERVLQCYYEQGKFLMDKGDYSEAVEAFESAGNYQDAAVRVTRAEDAQAEAEAEAAFEALKDKLEEADNACVSGKVSLASDRMSLSVDSKDKNDTAALMDILTIIEILELPDSVFDEMCNTTALMGKQNAQYGDFDISWSYHPDNGLDVIFKIAQ